MTDSAQNHSLTIDGKTVEVRPGTTILRAAQQIGIKIPTLCWHQRLDPIASCRVCLVKIEGYDDPVTACDTPAEPGMVVTTESDEITRLRRESLGYVLAHHPLDCPVCDKGGECLLQDLTYDLGVSEPLFPIEVEKKPDEIDTEWPLIIRNDERCIRCGRCVAVCQQVQAVGALKFTGHGMSAHVDTIDGGPLDCEFCGQCLNVCPVGALLSKPFLHKARVWDLERTLTTCSYCGVGCSLYLDARRNHIYRSGTPEDGPNKGRLCVRGTFGFGFEHNPERLATPMRRQGDQLRSLSVDKALDVAADALSQVIKDSGPAAVAALGSARMTNEENAMLAAFMSKAVGSPHVDSLAGLGYRQALDTVYQSLGSAHDAVIGELDQHDAILVIGSNLPVEMPVAGLELLWATRRLDADLMLLNNRPTKLEKYATFSPRLKPGGEAAAAIALIKWLVESGRFDEEFISKRCEGFQQAKEALSRMKLEPMMQASGLTHDDLTHLDNRLRLATRPLIVIGPELYEAPAGTAAVKALVHLVLFTGLAGKDARILISADRCNLRGAAQIARPGNDGLDTAAIFEAAFTGKIKALLLFGITPVINLPDQQRIEAALEKLDCLIVCDPFMTDSASRATVVLPTATYANKNGSFTAADGTLRRVNKAVNPPDRALDDMSILQELMRRLDGAAEAPSREQLTDAIKGIPAYKGLTADNMADCSWTPDRQAPETYPVHPMELNPDDMVPPTSDGYLALAAPILFHNGTLSTRAAEGPASLAPEGRLQLNPDDAQELGLTQGDRIRLTVKGSSLEGPVDICDEVPSKLILVPTHFSATAPGRIIDKGRVAAVEVEKVG